MLPPEYRVTLAQAAEFVEDVLDAGRVPMLHGSPGVGKSAIGRTIADKRNLFFIDERFAGYDPTDMNGFPDLDRDKGIAYYFPLATFPLEGDELPINPATGQPYAGWLFLADELTSAVPAVQAASYKFFLDRMVGQKKLHEKCYIMGAGNLSTDNAIVHDMSTALVSRLVNIHVELNQKEWLAWAVPNGIHPLITSFIDYRGSEFFYTFDAENPEQPFSCARTYEFASDLVHTFARKGVAMSSRTALMAGTIGAASAAALTGFAATWGTLPKLADIVANPETCEMPANPGAQYALTGAIGEWATADNLEALLKYVSRSRPDLQVLALRNVNGRHADLKAHPAAVDWMSRNMNLFLGNN